MRSYFAAFGVAVAALVLGVLLGWVLRGQSNAELLEALNLSRQCCCVCQPTEFELVELPTATATPSESPTPGPSTTPGPTSTSGPGPTSTLVSPNPTSPPPEPTNPPPEPTAPPPEPTQKPKCNNGGGNGSEGCSPSDQGNDDESSLTTPFV